MAEDRVLVKIKSEMGSEDAYFMEQDRKRIEGLREKAAQKATAKYCDEHKNHCFRCGTQSLVEVERGNVKVDICVNENCGAIHLDPGELEQLLQDAKVISTIRKCVFTVFKK